MREDDPAARITAPTTPAPLSTTLQNASRHATPSHHAAATGRASVRPKGDALAVTRTAVNRAPALAQHPAAPPFQDGAHLRDDRERDLGGRVRPDVQTGRRVEARPVRLFEPERSSLAASSLSIRSVRLRGPMTPM